MSLILNLPRHIQRERRTQRMGIWRIRAARSIQEDMACIADRLVLSTTEVESSATANGWQGYRIARKDE
jgi:hypothetical protein